MDTLENDKRKETTAEDGRKAIEIEVPDDDAVSTVGWDAITAECLRRYPNQKEPKHYGTVHPWYLGGPDPLDGMDVYDGGDYWHFVTYGLSELYDKVSEDPEWSGYGMEFTYKLKKDTYDDLEKEISCVWNILQTIAKITFSNGTLFLANQMIYTGQTEGIDAKQKSKLTGFITIPDTELNTIETPNGRVEFVEFIGATNEELLAIKNREINVQGLYEKIGSDITDYNRDSVI